MCGGFCRLSHLSRTTPPSLSGAALQLYDQDVRRCFSSCTAVDTSDAAWRQAILGLSKGGLGLRSLYQHAPAAYIASIFSAGFGSETNLHLCSAVADFNSAVPPDKALQIHSLLSASLVSQKEFSSTLDTCMFNLLLETSPLLTEHDCFQFPHHMHPPGCLFYRHRGWVYILMHRSIKLP